MPTFPTVIKSPVVLAGIVVAAALAVSVGLWQLLAPSQSPQQAALFQPSAQYQRIGEGTPLAMQFTVPMRQESVEQHLTIEPTVEGSVEWTDDRTVTFRPAAPLAMSGTYTVTVAPLAQRKDGAVLGASMTTKFLVAGAPRVSQSIPPPESQNVSPMQPVTIIFDRPMAALTTLTEQGNQFADWPVTITPPVAGTWKWLSTTTAEFTPADDFAPGTSYRVQVPAGISTVRGERTTEEFMWNFTTSRPAVETSEPPDGFEGSGPETEIVLHFNQEIDLQSVLAHTRLLLSVQGRRLHDDELGAAREANPSADIAVPVAFKAVYGQREEDSGTVTDTSSVVLIPTAPLAFDSWYTVIVDDGVMSPGGTLGSEAPFTMQFRTAGAMRMNAVRQEYGSLVFDFSNPYDAKTVKNAITIAPKPADWDDLTVEENFWDSTSLYLYPTLDPSTEYTINVTAALKDSFGQALQNPGEKFTFTTSAIEPRVFIHSNGDFGVFERDLPPVHYINAVNVDHIDVAFAQLSLEEFLQMQRQKYADWSFAPALQDHAMHRAWKFPVTTPKNEWQVVTLDLEKELGQSLPSGIYALTATAPEYHQYYEARQKIEVNYFTISSTSLTLKYSGNQALVWAVDMKTGAPIADAEITLHDLNGQAVVSGRTDSEGFFQTEINAAAFAVDGNTWNPEIWVTARTATDFAFVGSSWNSGMYPSDFGMSENWQPEGGKNEMYSHLYTDRPIYRTGDTVHFKGIVRLKDDRGVLSAPAQGRSIRVRIDDAEGNTVFSQTLPISAFGSFNGSMPIDTKAGLGTYWMNAEFEDSSDLVYNWASASFEVLAYRKPEFRVDVNFDTEEAFGGGTIGATIEGAYYFGMPMDDATVQWRAMTTDYYFNRYTDGWYSFSLEDSWCWYDCERESEPLADGEGTLDDTGKFHVKIPVDLTEEALSQVLSLDVDITDASNQVVSTRASIPVHKADVYVGIRPEDYVVQPGEEASVGLVTVMPDGTPKPNQRVEITVYKRTWNTTRKKGVDGAFYYDNEPMDERVDTTSVSTEADGKATAKVRIPAGGQYRVLAVVKDSDGREAKADTSIYAWSDTYFNWPHSNSNRMTVTADQPEYKAGETATLLVQSPFQGEGVSALVTVEREGIMSRMVVPITSSAQPITIPVTEEMIPNAYVSVVVVKPRVGETFNEYGLDTGAPAFRIGYAKLKVENASKGLTITIEPNKRRYLPAEPVEVRLLAQDAQGNPVQAEISLATVDMSVLALTGFRVPNLLDLFYADRGLGVRTAQNLLYILERFKPGSKGGGGGDLEERARGNFKDTAYWNPSIITGADGRASVQFTLPDNLTTWQILATGHTKDSLVGAFATEILETKQVIVRPVRPRFAVHGDKAELAAIVHNGMEEAASFNVILGGTGFEVADAEQMITIPANGQAKLVFPVTFASSGDKASFIFTAQGVNARDEIHESIPLVPFGIPHAVATSGFTDGEGAEETLFVPVKEEVTGVETEVTLSPTLATYLPKGLEYLVQYPYGCAEQTVSSFLPNIAMAELQGFDAFQVVSQEDLDAKVTAGLQRLITFQRSDGGFGYWEGSSESHTYLTAYIVHALHLTRNAGYTVDAGVLQNARSYLSDALRRHRMESDIDLSERAYILYVLGETGAPDQALLSNLYGQRDKLSTFSKAYLAMALDRIGDERRALSVLNEILATASVNPRGVQFEEKNGWQYRRFMSTDQRTTALVLQAMLRIDPQNTLVANVVRGMLAMRQGGHWDTTQSTTASIFSLVEFLEQTGELDGDFTATLSVDGTAVAEATFDATNILSRQTKVVPASAMTYGQMNPLQVAKEGAGRLYYDVLLTYFWKTQRIDPMEAGMSVMREITPVPGSVERPTVGSTYKVKVTITVPEERHFVAVESPHPAGMEGVDFALQTTQQHLQEEIQNEERSEWGWWWDSSWYFSHKEFRDDQVFLFADHLPAGVYNYEYLVRATLPGTFRWRPARAYEMYFPEVFGNTAGGVVQIHDAPQS
jgi:hypothetical protein